MPKKLVDMGNHPVLQGYVSAFREHSSRDDQSGHHIWLLIVQGLSHQLSKYVKELRSMFVSFDEKKELTVNRLDMNSFTATEPMTLFPDFAPRRLRHTQVKISWTY
jgi:hypothetical protein